jgi:hypothetical protein
MFKMIQRITLAAGFVLFIAMPQSLFSQITITQNDLLNAKGKTFTIELDTTGSVAVDVGTTGGPKTWNLRAVPLTNPIATSFEYLDAAGTPFAAEFPTANFVQKFSGAFMGFTSAVYGYFEVADNSIRSLGSVTSVTGFPPFIIREGDRVGTLPLTFGASWTDEIVTVTEPVPQFVTKDSTVTNSIVDAWGTVSLSSGNFDCLRICQQETRYTVVTVAGIPTSADTTSNISYIWASKNEFFVVAIVSQDDESNPNFTDASSFIRLTDSPQTGVDNPEQLTTLPTSFDLSQNYPNPFNPETEIQYTLGEPGHVELVILDAMGRQIKTLVSRHMAPGRYSASWNGMNEEGQKIASGQYVYRLSVNGTALSKMMVMIK